MKIGTRSLLYGVHQFALHPVFVWVAWLRLYGRPAWWQALAIIVHDWGYWGLPNMDGPEGDRHPERSCALILAAYRLALRIGAPAWLALGLWRAAREILLHSRFLARRYDVAPSELCWADKLGTAIMPTWLWVAQARATGELAEYMACTKYEDTTTRANGREFHRAYRRFITAKLGHGAEA